MLAIIFAIATSHASFQTSGGSQLHDPANATLVPLHDLICGPPQHVGEEYIISATVYLGGQVSVSSLPGNKFQIFMASEPNSENSSDNNYNDFKPSYTNVVQPPDTYDWTPTTVIGDIQISNTADYREQGSIASFSFKVPFTPLAHETPMVAVFIKGVAEDKNSSAAGKVHEYSMVAGPAPSDWTAPLAPDTMLARSEDLLARLTKRYQQHRMPERQRKMAALLIEGLNRVQHDFRSLPTRRNIDRLSTQVREAISFLDDTDNIIPITFDSHPGDRVLRSRKDQNEYFWSNKTYPPYGTVYYSNVDVNSGRKPLLGKDAAWVLNNLATMYPVASDEREGELTYNDNVGGVPVHSLLLCAKSESTTQAGTVDEWSAAVRKVPSDHG